MKKLKPEELRKTIDIKEFEGQGIKPEEIIGQERVKMAVKLLEIKKGFNLFVAGPVSAGKTKGILAELRKIASNKPTPPDLCYVENPNNPKEPRLLIMPPGTAKMFSEDLGYAIQCIGLKIQMMANDQEIKKTKELIEIQLTKEMEIKLQASQIFKEAEAKKIYLKVIQPLKIIILFETANGKVEINAEDFLDPEKDNELKNRCGNRFEEIKNLSLNLCEHYILHFEKERQKLLQKAVNEFCALTVKNILGNLAKKYPAAREHLQEIGDELLRNLNLLYTTLDQEVQFLLLQKIEKLTEVNIIVDNSKTHGAPIVVVTNPTYQNLFGYIEKFQTKDGFSKLPTFQNIRGGEIHKANGGYLIIDAENIFNQRLGYEIYLNLKQILKNKEMEINDPAEFYGLSVSYLKTKIPIDVKVILVGSKWLYSILNYYDKQFSTLFEKAEIEVKKDLTPELCNQLASHFRRYSCEQFNKPIDPLALARVIEYGLEIVESQEKITMQIGELEKVIQEANLYSENKISLEAIEKALEEKEFRENLIEETYLEYIGKNLIKIDVTGKKVGEINALAVFFHDNHEFGSPHKVTCNIFAGKNGLIFIDRIINQTGPIFNKASEILSSWLYSKFAKDKNDLSFTAKICFEQSYDELDGDSATLAEVAVLISEISGIPIRQDIAITGSMNQKGVVQPIGGVNYKIKGFYKACKNINFTGTQGVIVPKDNVKDLMLPKEIVQSVSEGKFSIYAVEKVEEALEILLDTEFSKIEEAVEKGLKIYHIKEKENLNLLKRIKRIFKKDN